MKKGPFKMPGYTYPGTSPTMKKGDSAIETEYTPEGDMILTDTKAGSSSKWNLTDKTKNKKKGTTTYTYTNPDTGAEKYEVRSPATKSSPAKGGWWAKQTKGHGGPS